MPALFALALAQAATAPVPAAAADPEAEVVVIGRRLAAWKGTLRDTLGIRRCRTTQSTGDPAIDSIGCRALTDCYVPARQSLSDARRSAGRDEAARQAAEAAVRMRIAACTRERRSALVTEFVAARQAKAGS